MRAASQADCSQGSRAHRKRDQDGRVGGTNMGAQAPPVAPGRGELQASLGDELLGQPLIKSPPHPPPLASSCLPRASPPPAVPCIRTAGFGE